MAGRLGRPRVGGWARGEGARWGGSGGLAGPGGEGLAQMGQWGFLPPTSFVLFSFFLYFSLFLLSVLD